MYKNFTQTTDGGYSLKKQGIISVIIFGTLFSILTIYLFINYFRTLSPTILYTALFMLAITALVFWRSTKQFIIYPQQQIFKYSKGIGAGFVEFQFDELDGSTQENIKNMYGIKTGNAFKLGFDQNGKYQEILLGQNISGKTMQSINEEIHQIMSLK